MLAVFLCLSDGSWYPQETLFPCQASPSDASVSLSISPLKPLSSSYRGLLSFILIKSEIEYQKLVYKLPATLCIPLTQRNSPHRRPEAAVYLELILPFCFGCHCFTVNCCLRFFPFALISTSVSPEPGREMYQSCLLYVSKGAIWGRRIGRQGDRQMDGHKHMQRETCRRSRRRTDGQTREQIDRPKWTGGQMDRQKDRQADRNRQEYIIIANPSSRKYFLPLYISLTFLSISF